MNIPKFRDSWYSLKRFTITPYLLTACNGFCREQQDRLFNTGFITSFVRVKPRVFVLRTQRSLRCYLQHLLFLKAIVNQLPFFCLQIVFKNPSILLVSVCMKKSCYCFNDEFLDTSLVNSIPSYISISLLFIKLYLICFGKIPYPPIPM